MGILTKLFGAKYKIRAQIIFDTAETAAVKTVIEGYNFTSEDIKTYIKDYVEVETGKNVNKIRLIKAVKI